MIDRQFFYKSIKPSLFTVLLQDQVDGCEAILNEWDRSGLPDIRWLAYMMATAYHETGKAMQAIVERGKGKGRPYGLKNAITGFVYFGRGLVQLTWDYNYRKIGKIIGVDLFNKPDLALNIDVAVKIMFEGMTRGSSSFGDFTGKSLDLYFNGPLANPKGARHIINGSDCDDLIAGYYNSFLKAIKEA